MAQDESGVLNDNGVLEATSFLYGSNAPYIEELYEKYRKDPSSVDASWRAFFDTLGDEARAALGGGAAAPAAPAQPAVPAQAAPATAGDLADARRAALDSVRAIQLIRAYRVLGHRVADLDPLRLRERGGPQMAEERAYHELDPEHYGFSEARGDWNRPVFIDGMLGLQTATVREIHGILRRTYCGKIGYEFIHITDPEQKSWLQQRIEGADKDVTFTPEGKKAILNKLIEAEGFEKFCSTRFLGAKRFGLDGGEALIPAMEQIIKRGGQLGAREITLGMAHRGRLNVLANVMGKPYRIIFHEFQGGTARPDDVQGSGDVKYHLGASSDRTFDGIEVHLSLSPNPSHLEAVNPVVLGRTRAKQLQRGGFDRLEAARTEVIPVLLHGDAAFAGQGVVAECFAMSGTKGYRTGGCIHIIINNQIGFTTDPIYARSSPYPSDVALMVQAPIFHVNGDDPEAVVHAVKIATEFRQKFKKDVVVDMFCYRRFGHNETDEPAFTQPLMYQAIAQQKSTLKLYGERLVAEGLLSEAGVQELIDGFTKRLNDEFEAAKGFRANAADWLEGAWAQLGAPGQSEKFTPTGVSTDVLKQVGAAITSYPEGFAAHRTIARQLEQKKKMFESGEGFDWATCEALAFGTLVLEGTRVRLAGQDASRGTFSQRHAALVDQTNGQRYVPLAHLKDGQGEFEVVDSFLSEEAAMGFEYGFSLAEPKALVCWEAQFGDFANGAQVQIDQFIASGAAKWLRLSGVTLLLPHGYEGQGPEHSSARPERFLQLCAEDNMRVAYPSTPANYFHILRRQLYRSSRQPLVLMTPKSLLRHKKCVSWLIEMQPNTMFNPILWDDAERIPGSTLALAPDAEIRRVVMCTGKVYYDLLEAREKRQQANVYLLRVEELYPYPAAAIERVLGRFPNASATWCQEEPQNMGAWTFIEPRIEQSLQRLGRGGRAAYAGREAAASPATGLLSTHQAETQKLLDQALTL